MISIVTTEINKSSCLFMHVSEATAFVVWITNKLQITNHSVLQEKDIWNGLGLGDLPEEDPPFETFYQSCYARYHDRTLLL